MSNLQLGRVIIAGGGGMLAAASGYIADRACELTLVSRTPGLLAGQHSALSVPLDWRNPEAAIVAVNSLSEADFLLSWLHDDGVWLAENLEARLVAGGRSIRVHGANSRDPAIRAQRDRNPRKDIVRQVVMLGWVNAADGARWLTHEEISDAVIQAVNAPQRETIVAGTVDGLPPV